MTDPSWSPLWLSLKVATLATAVSLTGGLGAALALGRVPAWGRRWLEALLTLPLVLPPTVLGYYLLVLVGRRGWFGAWLWQWFGFSLVFTWQGAVVAAAVVAFPLVFRSARAALEGVDPVLLDAARTLGQPEPLVVLRVAMPLAWPGIVAGTLLAFARAMGEFGATLMVAGNLPGRTQTLSLAVYDAVQAGREGTAHLLVLITSAVCLTVLVASGRLLRREERLVP